MSRFISFTYQKPRPFSEIPSFFNFTKKPHQKTQVFKPRLFNNSVFSKKPGFSKTPSFFNNPVFQKNPAFQKPRPFSEIPSFFNFTKKPHQKTQVFKPRLFNNSVFSKKPGFSKTPSFFNNPVFQKNPAFQKHRPFSKKNPTSFLTTQNTINFTTINR